ncbi:MAG: hypothetical protein OEO23_09445 [Gemmatimonadota bacterium]|nr:hypothetical protein [Gemmatimonadota bacterium]
MVLDRSQARRAGRLARPLFTTLAFALALSLGISALAPGSLEGQSPPGESGGGGGDEVSDLPPGHVWVTHESRRYGFHDGRFYEWLPDRRVFQVVDAPVGAAVPNVPRGARVRELRGVTYHVYRGVHYKAARRHGKPVFVVAKI